MEAFSSCDAKLDHVSKPFRHLLLKHQLLRTNPVVLSIFTKYFLAGSWLVHLHENCYDEDADESAHDVTPPTNAGSSFFPSFAVSNSNSSVVHPEEEPYDKCTGDFRTRHFVDNFSLPINVKSELYKFPWYSTKVAAAWGSVTLEDLVGNDYTAAAFAAGIALQCFTESSLFHQLIRREWIVDEAVITMPTFTPIERKAFTKYNSMNLKLIYILNAMSLHMSTRLAQVIHPGCSFNRTSDLPLEEVMQFFAQNTWVCEMETLIDRLPVALTVCTADLTVIPCTWRHEFINAKFTHDFASIKTADTTTTVNTPQPPKDDNSLEYDNMHMVSLMQRAMKHQATLQVEILNNIGSGVGTVKFGLQNVRSPRRSPSSSLNTNNDESKQDKDEFPQEFVHMVCLAPIFQMSADDEKNSRADMHALLPMANSAKPAFSDHVGCFGRWFPMFASSSSSSPSSGPNGEKPPPNHTYHNHSKSTPRSMGGCWNEDEASIAQNSAAGGGGGGADSEAKIVAMHMDMSRASAQASDLVKMCLVSFLVARLLE
jgi:hypothetical protein